ncbi:MAG: (Fe-S)-binding protein [Desulfobacteraceae bacterium]|nr:(Fe-S)-binding protein [Desulfobacteraceae bacterium]
MKPDFNRVSIFIPCIVDRMYPEVGDGVVRVLDRLNIAITIPPDQTCCGQPAYNAGYSRAAEKAARHFIRLFKSAEVIVCPSGSCVHMIRHGYPQLFKVETDLWRQAVEIAKKTYEFSEFLVDVIRTEDVQAEYEGRLTYHASCHLNFGLGIDHQPRRLIRNIRKAEFIDMTDADRCCGFGGLFSVKYPEISTSILDEKIEQVLATGADTLVGCDMGCLLNIQGRLNRRSIDIKVRHLAQVLAG